MKKTGSKRWEVYHVPEGVLKNYKNMQKDKTRPVLVISDSSDLIDRCLLVELGSHKNNENHIFGYSYFSKKHNKKKNSYIKPDCIHTVSRGLLTYKHRSYDKTILPESIKSQIINYVNKIVNEKENVAKRSIFA